MSAVTMAKRLFDITFSIIGLLIFSPLYLIIFLGIKLSCEGPVIFKQERIGKNGKPFYIYKFRTMIVNNELDGIPQLAEPNDQRLTKFGKFLRSHHLDELPQLWNVLIGDMSFIGYRPERKYFIDQIMEHDPRYVELYQMRPGITSYATLYNGYTDTMEKMLRRLELDLYYMEHQSWELDLSIIFKTFTKIAFGKKI
ncbi:sugar transferase [Prevotella sp. E15-22]|jgi:lipopolysaccharide/colanic/teichoic acid biosynthesis glycosyltransferase|uniref:sugar transferase n=1 Tax=Prevotella sp. E15-22 TaxID=2937774 RepID=UPI00206FA6C3|nr:sugar transferase [Prevotella sp. E15-22]UPS45224.1 sugar transferase [Prevotella sp. E15-22]